MPTASLVASLASLAAAACAREPAAPPLAALAGSYRLATVDGAPVPAATAGRTFVDGDLTLDALGTYRWTRRVGACVRGACDTTRLVEENGWERRGRDTLVLHPLSFRPDSYRLRVEATRLVLVEGYPEPVTFVYVRR